MRDSFLEIDMVLSGFSVVSNVGFKQKNLEVQKQVRNVWKCNGNIQHLRMSGSIESYLFQSCLLLFVNISSICLLGKGFAPLRCTRTVKAPWGLWNAVDGLWLLCAHGAGFSVLWPNCGCGKHLTSRLVLHGFALFCTSPNEGGKHLTGTLFLHRPACGNYSVKSISGLLNVSFTSAHHSHVLCRMSIYNIHLETGLYFAQPQNWIFDYRSVIVRDIVWGHGQETQSARSNVLKRNSLAGTISTMAVLLRAPKKSTPCRTLCKMSIRTALDGEILVIGLCEGSAK